MSNLDDPQHPEHVATMCRQNADFMLKLARETDPHVEFGLAGAQWLDRYIDGVRATVGNDQLRELTILLGCFHGECLIATIGGRWVRSGGMIGVAFGDTTGTVPFSAVASRLVGVEGGSITSAFNNAVSHFGWTEEATMHHIEAAVA